MLQIDVKDLVAWEELKKQYGISYKTPFIRAIRKLTSKLLAEDDLIEFAFPIGALSPCYQKNIRSFCDTWRKGQLYKIHGRLFPKLGICILRAGYEARPFEFAKNLTAEFKKKHVRAVDVMKSDIPKSYMENLYNFDWRLTQRLKTKIKHLDLGEEIRFYKHKP